jgi:hypothetical protein
MTLKEIGFLATYEIDSTGSGINLVAGSCECDMKLRVLKKARNFSTN